MLRPGGWPVKTPRAAQFGGARAGSARVSGATGTAGQHLLRTVNPATAKVTFTVGTGMAVAPAAG
jgi:hypothetical protein